VSRFAEKPRWGGVQGLTSREHGSREWMLREPAAGPVSVDGSGHARRRAKHRPFVGEHVQLG